MRHALAFTKDATGTIGHDPHGYFDFDGTPSPSMINWFPDCSTPAPTPASARPPGRVTGNSQYVVLGGEFPTVNGIGPAGPGPVRGRAASPRTRSVRSTPGRTSSPSLVALPSGKVRVAWQANYDRDDLTLTYKLIRNGAHRSTPTTDSSTFWNRPTMGFIDTDVDRRARPTRTGCTATDAAGNIAPSDNVSITAPAGRLGQRLRAEGHRRRRVHRTGR